MIFVGAILVEMVKFRITGTHERLFSDPLYHARGLPQTLPAPLDFTTSRSTIQIHHCMNPVIRVIPILLLSSPHPNIPIVENTRDLPSPPHYLHQCGPRKQSQHHPAGRH